jgi:general secretion pathway protein M
MKLLAWFQKFTQREQIYLLGVAAVLILYLLIVVLWKPLAGLRTEMTQRNIQVAEQLTQMKAMAGQLLALQAGGNSQARLNLNQLINSSTNQFGIRPTRIQPNSRGETQLRFEAVEFAKLLRWLHAIESTQDVAILEVAVNQGDAGGLVKATIRLGQGS